MGLDPPDSGERQRRKWALRGPKTGPESLGQGVVTLDLILGTEVYSASRCL